MSRTVIIGGGIIGLCCAYELRRRGEEVVVLDRGEPGAGASSGNAGLIVPAFSGPVAAPGMVGTTIRSILRRDSPVYLNPRALPELDGWLWAFWRHCNTPDYDAGFAAMAGLGAPTLALFDALSADGVQFEMHRSGLLFVFTSEAGLAHVLEDLDRLQEQGYRRPALLEKKDLRDLEPALADDVAAGLLLEQERHVQPDTLVDGLLARLKQLGADLRPGTEAVGVRRQNHAVTGVQTRADVVAGDRYIIAAGAWSGTLAGLCGVHLPVQAAKGYSITVANPLRRFARPIYFGEAKTICSPFQGATRVAGWLEFSGIDASLDAYRIEALRRAADRYLPGWQAGGPQRLRAGLRPLTPDGLPAIGRAPGYENLYIATGHGVLGVTLAPATAVALADLVTQGRTNVDLRPFDPARFSDRSSGAARPADAVMPSR